MQSNNNFNILNNINFHTSSTPCYWWSRWKPPTPTATASGWPAAPARAATSGAAARCRPACAALHRLHTSSLCLQHSMQASVWSSTARSTRAISHADACDQPAPSRSRCPCPAHRCGLCDGLLHLYACLWYVMSHAYLAIAVVCLFVVAAFVCLFVVCHVACLPRYRSCMLVCGMPCHMHMHMSHEHHLRVRFVRTRGLGSSARRGAASSVPVVQSRPHPFEGRVRGGRRRTSPTFALGSPCAEPYAL